MKKIMSLIIAILVLLSCFSFSTFAIEYDEQPYIYTNYLDPTETIIISDDYQHLTLGDNSYSRFSGNDSLQTYDELENEIFLSPAQELEVKNIVLHASKNGYKISAYIYFLDGATLSVTFYLDEYIQEYERLKFGDFEDYYIVFQEADYSNNSEEIILETTKELLMSEEVELTVNDFLLTASFDVCCKSTDLNLYVTRGSLIKYDELYYYIDFDNTNSSNKELDLYNYEGKAYKISDPLLLQRIEEESNRYYGESDYGVLFDDELSKAISNAFLILVFIIIPFVIFILSLIFGIKSKKVYKKLFFTICALSVAILITSIIVILMVY